MKKKAKSMIDLWLVVLFIILLVLVGLTGCATRQKFSKPPEYVPATVDVTPAENEMTVIEEIVMSKKKDKPLWSTLPIWKSHPIWKTPVAE